MKKDQIISLVETLNAKPDIFICGPSYGGTKLRVYACGGLLCELPTVPRAEISLLDENYLPKDSPLLVTLQGLKNSGNEQKEKFLRDHLDTLLLFMENRFTSKKYQCRVNFSDAVFACCAFLREAISDPLPLLQRKLLPVRPGRTAPRPKITGNRISSCYASAR